MKIFICTLIASLVLGGRAQAADNLTLQLKWVTQAQFAGYYVAQAKGFYKGRRAQRDDQAGRTRHRSLAGSGRRRRRRDRRVDAGRPRGARKGVPEVNIAQVYQRSGLELTCRKDSGVRTPADFKGKTLGVWFAGNEYPFLSWMSKLGYKTDGGPSGVTVLKQGFNVDPLLQKQAACISTMTYNEYWQLIEAST